MVVAHGPEKLKPTTINKVQAKFYNIVYKLHCAIVSPWPFLMLYVISLATFSIIHWIGRKQGSGPVRIPILVLSSPIDVRRKRNP